MLHRSFVNTDRYELTKFFNRRAYDEKIEELMKNPVEDDITIISMDVNGLKVVNDNLGHQAGDELLTGACSCMTLAFGSYASLYRLGGDEFIALICSKSPDLDMLVEKFNSILKSWHGNLVSEISVSTGYASTKEYPGMDLHELEKIADKRMYMDKNNYYRTKGIDRRNRQ